MLLYNEDILDCLDQALCLELNQRSYYNCMNAYDLSSVSVREHINVISKALNNYENQRKIHFYARDARRASKRRCPRAEDT